MDTRILHDDYRDAVRRLQLHPDLSVGAWAAVAPMTPEDGAFVEATLWVPRALAEQARDARVAAAKAAWQALEDARLAAAKA